VPEDDIKFMRYESELSRILQQKHRSQQTMHWYTMLLQELVKRQSESTIHPAQRFILQRVQTEIKEGRGLSAKLMEEFLIALAVEDPLYVPPPTRDDARLGAALANPTLTSSATATNPYGAVMTALSIVHSFIEKLRMRAARARDAATGTAAPAASTK